MNDYEFDELAQYENYDVDPVSPYALLQRMAAWNKEVRITVTDLVQQTEAQIAVLQGEINLRVTSEEFLSQIQILEGEIGLRVMSNEIIQSINLSQEGLKINVSKMDISGLVTVTALGTSGATIIHGGNILTGTILADRIATTQLSSISANLGTITAGTINSVQINGANINITQSISVGRYLNVGNGFNSSEKGITFVGTAIGIYANGDNLNISADNINFATSSITGLSSAMEMRAALSHQIGTTFEINGNNLILRTPSGTTKTFVGS